MLRTAGRLGIQYYRMNSYRYNDSRPVIEQADKIKSHMRGMADLGKEFGVVTTFQNHAGDRYVGAPLWGLHYLMHDLDPKWIGVQYDIRHAVVEGGMTWPTTLRLLAPFINTLAMKDFVWAQGDNGSWTAQNCPLGEGMVDLPAFVGC